MLVLLWAIEETKTGGGVLFPSRQSVSERGDGGAHQPDWKAGCRVSRCTPVLHLGRGSRQAGLGSSRDQQCVASAIETDIEAMAAVRQRRARRCASRAWSLHVRKAAM